MTTPTPHLETVRIERSDNGSYIVRPVWQGVDRPITTGYSCGTNEQLADRLADAILCGAALTSPEVVTDCNGQTYVSAEFQIRMRYAGSELAKLGY